jgi:hypothetical protein
MRRRTGRHIHVNSCTCACSTVLTCRGCRQSVSRFCSLMHRSLVHCHCAMPAALFCAILLRQQIHMLPGGACIAQQGGRRWVHALTCAPPQPRPHAGKGVVMYSESTHVHELVATVPAEPRLFRASQPEDIPLHCHWWTDPCHCSVLWSAFGRLQWFAMPCQHLGARPQPASPCRCITLCCVQCVGCLHVVWFAMQ